MNSKYEEAVMKGMKRARANQKGVSAHKKMMVPIAASFLLVGFIGLQSPAMANALSEVGKVFEGFSTALFGRPTDKFSTSATMIGESVSDKKASITLNEAILDENLLMLALTVNSEFLEGYTGLNENDFFNLDFYLFVDGQQPESVGSLKVRQLDETTGSIIIESNIASMNLSEQAKIKLNISAITRGYESLNGSWNFEVELKKLEGGKRITPNLEFKLIEDSVSVDEVIVSKLATTILMSSSGSEMELFNTDMMVKDSLGHIYFPSGSGWASNSTYESEKSLEIQSDLTDVEWIEIMPKDSVKPVEVYDQVYYSILQTPGDDINQDQYQIISRAPYPYELAAGYALDEVKYYVNLTDETSFKPLSDLIGSEILVNTTDKVVIEDIELGEDFTKITFKIPTYYPAALLSGAVLFDEELNDTSRREGQKGVAIEDEKEGRYSITLDAINPNKAYTIAIPFISDMSEEEPVWSIKIPLTE